MCVVGGLWLPFNTNNRVIPTLVKIGRGFLGWAVTIHYFRMQQHQYIGVGDCGEEGAGPHHMEERKVTVKRKR